MCWTIAASPNDEVDHPLLDNCCGLHHPVCWRIVGSHGKSQEDCHQRAVLVARGGVLIWLRCWIPRLRNWMSRRGPGRCLMSDCAWPRVELQEEVWESKSSESLTSKQYGALVRAGRILRRYGVILVWEGISVLAKTPLSTSVSVIVPPSRKETHLLSPLWAA